MPFKIITIPFDEQICEFKNELLDKYVNNKKVEYFTTTFVSINEKPYWSLFIKYSELDGIEIHKEKVEKEEQQFNEAEKKLFKKLKEWRSEEAKTAGVPSYVIAKNEHLVSIIKNNPKTLQDLKLINGIGEKKIKEYGEKVLGILKNFYGDINGKS